MPIKIPYDLHAARTLRDENIFVMTLERARTQDIRPLRILVLNLMPTKVTTETQLARLLGNTPLQVELELLTVSGHTPTHYILIICPRQISGDEDEAARELIHFQSFRRTILSYAYTDIFGKSSYGRGHSIRRGNRHTQRDALRRI